MIRVIGKYFMNSPIMSGQNNIGENAAIGELGRYLGRGGRREDHGRQKKAREGTHDRSSIAVRVMSVAGRSRGPDGGDRVPQ